LCTDSKFALAPTGAMETLFLQDLQMDGVLYPEFPKKTKRQPLPSTAVLSSTRIAYSEHELSRKHLMECGRSSEVYCSAGWLPFARKVATPLL
jgi:hypothetical protein